MISKKSPNRIVKYDYCLVEMRFDSICNHKIKSCVVYKLFGRTKKQIDNALNGNTDKLNPFESQIKTLI